MARETVCVPDRISALPESAESMVDVVIFANSE